MTRATFEIFAADFERKYGMHFPQLLDMEIPTVPIYVPTDVVPVQNINIYHNTIEPYDLHPLIKKFIEPYYKDIFETFISSGAYNGLMTRIDSFSAKTLTLKTRPLFYFDHWLVHYHAYDDLALDKSIASLFSDKLVLELDNPAEESIFPSGLGFDAIVLTSDGHLILPVRSKQVMIEKKKFAPSVSGGLKWKFFPYEYQKGYYTQIKEELKEEFGIVVTPNDKFIMLGFEKNLPYFGHPNMYFLGILEASSTNLIGFRNFEHDAVETIKIVNKPGFTHEKLHQIYKALLEILQTLKKTEISYQLAAATYYLGEYMKNI